MTDEIRKAAEEYVNEAYYSFKRKSLSRPAGYVLHAVEHAIREDRKRRDKLLAVRYKNMAEKKCEEPATAEMKVKSDNEDPNLYHEMRREYEDRMGDGKDDLESMLVELAKLTEDPELYCRDDHWELMIDGEEPGPEQIKEFHGKTPTEAVRAALDEMKKQ
jgi:hypothetical protein